MKTPKNHFKNRTATAMPLVIAVRTDDELLPLHQKWRRQNPGVPWSVLLRSALRQAEEYRELAGKRHAHLVMGQKD